MSYFSASVFIGFAGKQGWGFGPSALLIGVGNALIGALAAYVAEGGLSSKFQPMNANFGIIAPFEKKIKGGK